MEGRLLIYNPAAKVICGQIKKCAIVWGHLRSLTS